MAVPDTASGWQVTVAEDKLKAWLRYTPRLGSSYAAPTAEHLLEQLQAAHIALTDAVRQRAADLAALCATGGDAPPQQVLDGCLIAEGCTPVNAEDGRFEWAPGVGPTATADDKERVDYFARREIVSVTAGSVIGRLVPPQDAQKGLDVHGAQRIPRKNVGKPMRLGAGLRLADDGAGVIAETDGRVTVADDQVRLCDVLNIDGDVDFSSGSVETTVDVEVRGAVRTRFYVHTTKSLTVGKVIEAAEIQVGEDLLVRGGVLAQGQGAIRAGGDVTASFFHEADIHAQGTVRFQKEVLNCRIWTPQHVFGASGTIIGGDVYAREGLEAKDIGSEACVPTRIAFGVEVAVLRRARQLEQQVKSIEKSAEQIRQMIQPLMANLKRLTAPQRERVTDLMSKADELERQIDDLRAERTQLLENGQPRGAPALVIHGILHPGVRLTCGAREYRTARLLHGPLRIEVRKVDDVTQLVAVQQRTGSVTILPAAEVDLDTPPEGRKGDRKHELETVDPHASRG